MCTPAKCPLGDIVVIAFMLGGTALCVTALILAWRAPGKKLRRMAANGEPTSVYGEQWPAIEVER